MATLAELLKESGVELSGEQLSKLGDLVEKSDEVSGLKATKDDLLSWKQNIAPKLSQFEADLEAQKQLTVNATAKELETAKAAGDWQKVAEMEQTKSSSLLEQITASREATRKSTHESAVTKIQSVFEDPTTGRDMALNRVNTSITEDGLVVNKFSLGDQEFSTSDELIAAMVSNPSYAAMMKAPNSSGANSNGGGGQSNFGSPQSLEECKGNRKLEAEFFNNQLAQG